MSLPVAPHDRKVRRNVLIFFRVCRLIGYLLLIFMMADAPLWAWGIVLAVFLKPTNDVTVK